MDESGVPAVLNESELKVIIVKSSGLTGEIVPELSSKNMAAAREVLNAN